LRRDRIEFKCPNLNGKDNILRQKVGFYTEYLDKIPDEDSWSFEAFVVNHADEIAQRQHDIEDGIISNIFEPMYFIKKFKECFEGAEYCIEELENETTDKDEVELEYLLPMLAGFIVDFYVKYYISSVAQKLDGYIKKHSIKTNSSFHEKKIELWNKEDITNVMSFDEVFRKSDEALEKLLYNRIISSQQAKLMDGKGSYIIRKLFEAYLSTPNQLPDNIVKNFFTDYGLFKKEDKEIKGNIGWLREDLEGKTTLKDEKLLSNLCRNICDYIASMTDKYALKQYEKLYGSIDLS
jgi:dGTPase